MNAQANSRTAGFVLIGAALLGVIAMSVFPRAQRSLSGSPGVTTTPAAIADTSSPADSAPQIVVPVRERTAMWLADSAVASLSDRCVATVKEKLSASSHDSSVVFVTERYGFKPTPGRGQDSLIVEGTAPGTDATPAVWHCAATAYPTGMIATLRVEIEDGWPGVPALFEHAHAITIAAEDACLQRTKRVLKEYELRGVRRWRVSDTLRVVGEAMPLNIEDLAVDFHCSAVVRDNRVVSIVAAAGK
jgi:hypothetical protein